MKIQSKPYGEIEIDRDKIVTVKGGLFGFEDKEEYVIIGRESEQPFEWLQAINDPDLAFVVVPPNLIRPDYELSVLPEDLNQIEADSVDDLMLYSIVVVPENPDEMTINFRGPLIVNQENFLAKQVINQVDEYTVRHRVLDELEASGRQELVAKGGSE